MLYAVAALGLDPIVLLAHSELVDERNFAIRGFTDALLWPHVWTNSYRVVGASDAQHPTNWAPSFTFTVGSRAQFEGDAAGHSVFARLGPDDYVLRTLSGGDEEFELMRHEGLRYTVRVEGQCVELSATPIEEGE